MDGRDLDYYAEMNTNGSIKYLEVSDVQFYYQYKENESGVFIPKNVDIGTLTVNVKNQSYKTFKFLNIKRDELVENVTGQINDKSYKSVRLSQEETKKYEQYLTWIGIYNGYLQVYSYYNGQSRSGQRGNETVTGFTSFDISAYEGKVMNIQITARRGDTDTSKNVTRVYINVVEKKVFNSGITLVDYSIVTIGDLRPSRGLKYAGKIYDLALYNTELSTNAIRHNWNYFKDKWNIN